jgi:acyl-homoserine-lactone acylase
VVNGLERLYGKWKIPWGEINRFQRNANYRMQKFNDNEKSYPSGLASAFYGSLPSYETVWSDGKKQYGVAGNSFVAVVEFGDRVKARSVITGGQSFDHSSVNFNDQVEMFLGGKMKEVSFYREDVDRNAKKVYKPGR